MVQKNQKWDKIYWLLFEDSSKSFTIREISKKTGIPTSSVQRYLKSLRKEGLILEDNRPIINRYFKFKKCFFLINKMFQIGLIDHLEEKFNASAIIIFGSVRKGEYEKNSDIDLFIESTKEIKLDLSDFEKKLDHNIQLFIERDIKNLPPKLFNNVVNGIKLSGYFKLK